MADDRPAPGALSSTQGFLGLDSTLQRLLVAAIVGGLGLNGISSYKAQEHGVSQEDLQELRDEIKAKLSAEITSTDVEIFRLLRDLDRVTQREEQLRTELRRHEQLTHQLHKDIEERLRVIERPRERAMYVGESGREEAE